MRPEPQQAYSHMVLAEEVVRVSLGRVLPWIESGEFSGAEGSAEHVARTSSNRCAGSELMRIEGCRLFSVLGLRGAFGFRGRASDHCVVKHGDSFVSVPRGAAQCVVSPMK